MGVFPARRSRRAGLIAATLAASALVVSGCSSDPAAAGDPADPDNGTTLTMWTRQGEGDPVVKLVEMYNASHENQIDLTVVPGEAFQQKVGAAAGAGDLPDILGSDVVYSPNYVDSGLYQDITEAAQSLPFADTLSQAHQRAATVDGKTYGLPLVVDSSLIMYNKDLFTQAGLDPEAPPTDFEGIYAAAKAVRALGGDTYGFYFAGNCSGCQAYTMMPFGAAAGTPVISEDGATAAVDSPAMTQAAQLYRRMVTEDLSPSAVATEDGSTWGEAFNAGQIGMVPIGNFNFKTVEEGSDFDWGVMPIPAPDGSATSTFVGGDVVGITRDSEHYTQALDFLTWQLSDEPQLEVFAANGLLTARFDLAENEYTRDDPAAVTTIKGLETGYTPASTAYGEIFNSATGPWISGLRSYIFDGDDAALRQAQDAVQQSLDEAR